MSSLPNCNQHQHPLRRPPERSDDDNSHPSHNPNHVPCLQDGARVPAQCAALAAVHDPVQAAAQLFDIDLNNASLGGRLNDAACDLRAQRTEYPRQPEKFLRRSKSSTAALSHTGFFTNDSLACKLRARVRQGLQSQATRLLELTALANRPVACCVVVCCCQESEFWICMGSEGLGSA